MRCFTIFLDCRCDDSEQAYEEFRRSVHEQCSQMLALTIFRGANVFELRVRLHLHFATHVETHEHQPRDSELAAYHPWFTIVDRIMTLGKSPQELARRQGIAEAGNKLCLVARYLHYACYDTAQEHLFLFCSMYVNVAETTRELADFLGKPGKTQITCVLVDRNVPLVSMAPFGGRMRFFRCPLHRIKLQSALQAALEPFLLPGVRLFHRVVLQLGDDVVPCRATAFHYAAAIRRCCALSTFTAITANFLPSYFAGNVVRTCPTEYVRQTPAGGRGGEPPRVLRLRLCAVIMSHNVDEAMLFGDTMALTWDGDGAATATDTASQSTDAFTRFRTLLSVFRDDALVFSGDEGSVVSRDHLAMRRHHFVAFVSDDHTMRMREIVPTELRFVPFAPPPQSGGVLRCDGVLQRSLGQLRTYLISQSATAGFSMDALLRAHVCELAREVRPNRLCSLVLPEPEEEDQLS